MVILTDISIFFPFSNKFINLIPLQAYGDKGGVFDLLSPSLITTVATLFTLFFILGTFSDRGEFKEKQKYQGIKRNAWISFIIGILALVIYLVIYMMISYYPWEHWGYRSGNPAKLFAEIPLMFAYSFFFAFMTRAFMLLAMIEYFGAETQKQ